MLRCKKRSVEHIIASNIENAALNDIYELSDATKAPKTPPKIVLHVVDKEETSALSSILDKTSSLNSSKISIVGNIKKYGIKNKEVYKLMPNIKIDNDVASNINKST